MSRKRRQRSARPPVSGFAKSTPRTRNINGGGRSAEFRGQSAARSAIRRLSHRHPVFLFLLTFTLLAGIFYAVTFFTPFYRERFFPLVLRLTAQLAGAVLAFLGQDIAVSGTSISAPGFSVSIVRGCDAVEPIILFVCAVLAFPLPLGVKLPGVITGALVLATLNFVRIVSLFLIGVYVPGIFGVMHVDVWQGVFIVLALVLWLLWLVWANHRQMPPARAST